MDETHLSENLNVSNLDLVEEGLTGKVLGTDDVTEDELQEIANHHDIGIIESRNPIISAFQPGITSLVCIQLEYYHTSSDEEDQVEEQLLDDPGLVVHGGAENPTAADIVVLESRNPIISAFQPGITSLVCIQMEYYHTSSDEESEDEEETLMDDPGLVVHRGADNPTAEEVVLLNKNKGKPEKSSVHSKNQNPTSISDEEDTNRKGMMTLHETQKEEESRARRNICQKWEENEAERRRELGLPAEYPIVVEPTAPVVQEKKGSASSFEASSKQP